MRTAPGSAELPGFILDIDRQAAQAGLRLERCLDSGDELVTRYHGTKEQIAASGFIPKRWLEQFRWPRGRSPCSVHVFNPGGGLGSYGGRVYRNDDGTFHVRLRQGCPRNLTRLGEELERYEITNFRGVVICHYGTQAALLEAGIAQKDAFPDDANDAHRYSTGACDDHYNPSWRTAWAPNGWYVHYRYPDRERKKTRAEIARPDFANADEYRAFLEARLIRCSQLAFEPALDEIGGLKPSRFTIDAKAIEEIMVAIREAAQRVRSVPVRDAGYADPDGGAGRRAFLRLVWSSPDDGSEPAER